MPAQKPSNKVMVWDPLVRLFHWSLVAACLIAWFTQAEEYELHLLSGYLVLGLICFRLIWGFIGPTHARFSDFVFPSATVISYLRSLFTGRPRRYLGHNPAGGAMVVALLLTLLVITLSGVALDAAENRAGPLAGYRLFLYGDRIAEIHQTSTWIAVVLVPLHLVGVFVSSRLHRENLLRSMITGTKPE